MPACRFCSARSPGNRLPAIAPGSPCFLFFARLLTHPHGEDG